MEELIKKYLHLKPKRIKLNSESKIITRIKQSQNSNNNYTIKNNIHSPQNFEPIKSVNYRLQTEYSSLPSYKLKIDLKKKSIKKRAKSVNTKKLKLFTDKEKKQFLRGKLRYLIKNNIILCEKKFNPKSFTESISNVQVKEYKNRFRNINYRNNNAEIFSKKKIEEISKSDEERYKAIEDLKNILGLSKLERIELFDNSHLFGTYYVGGMVVYRDFLPDRNEYRKYKIDLHTKDDLSAMKEVFYRRYQRALVEKTELPDLIIVDGGELQIKAALQVLNSLKMNLPIVGLKKNKSHKTSKLVLPNLTEITIENQNLFVYLYKMQEEVHRFAITYHKNIKNKGMLRSVLEDVSGIGEKRRKELLKKYTSLTKIKNASIEELSEILPEEVAKSLLEFLNKEKN